MSARHLGPSWAQRAHQFLGDVGGGCWSNQCHKPMALPHRTQKKDPHGTHMKMFATTFHYSFRGYMGNIWKYRKSWRWSPWAQQFFRTLRMGVEGSHTPEDPRLHMRPVEAGRKIELGYICRRATWSQLFGHDHHELHKSAISGSKTLISPLWPATWEMQWNDQTWTFATEESTGTIVSAGWCFFDAWPKFNFQRLKSISAFLQQCGQFDMENDLQMTGHFLSLCWNKPGPRRSTPLGLLGFAGQKCGGGQRPKVPPRRRPQPSTVAVSVALGP